MSRKYRKRDFVGTSRIELVNGLVQLFRGSDDQRSSGSQKPIWVSLEAPPGWGKTRIALEFYSQLAENQDTAYWPSEIPVTEMHSKRTHPQDFVRAQGSLPEFLWLGIACSHRHGSATEAWRTDIQQLEPHLIFLGVQHQRVTKVVERWSQTLREKRRQITEKGIIEAVPYALDFLNISFSHLGLVAETISNTAKAIQNHIEVNKSVSTQTLISIPPKSNEVDEVVLFLTRISKRGGIPVVLFVEDVHLADAMVYEFIERLMNEGGSVFILTTGWPRELKKCSELQRMFKLYDDRLYHVTDKAAAPHPFPAEAGLRELEKEAREEILRGYFREFDLEVNDRTAAMLVAKYRSPLTMEAICKSARWRRKAHDGVITLTPEDVSALPVDLDGIYSSLWYDLSPAEKATTVVAWFLSPANINAEAAPQERRWSHPFLREVLTRLTFNEDDEDYEDIVGDVDSDAPGAWIRTIDEHLRTFLEPLHNQVVGKLSALWLGEQIEDDAREQTLTTFASRLTESVDREFSSTHLARAVLALNRAGFIDDLQIVAQAINSLLIHLTGDEREYRERDRLWEMFRDIIRQPAGHQISEEVQFSIRRSHATRLIEEEMPIQAIEVLSKLVKDMSESSEFGWTHPETLDVRHELAECQCGLLRYEGISSLSEIARDMRRAKNVSRSAILKVELTRAFYEHDPDNYDKALERLIAISESSESEVIEARMASILLYFNCGKYDRVLAKCDKLISEFGDGSRLDHSTILSARRLKVSTFQRMNRMADALDCTRENLEGLQAIAGADDIEVLKERISVAELLYQNGEHLVALAEADRLVPIARESLGSDHPVLRDAERTLIRILSTLKDHDRAIELSSIHLSSVLESTSSDDLAGSYAWDWHGHVLEAADRLDEAIDARRELLTLSCKMRGSHHHSIYFQRQMIVDLLIRAGDEPAALDESRRLVRDVLTNLDPNVEDELMKESIEELIEDIKKQNKRLEMGE